MFHRFLITQMPLFGFQFLGRSWGSLGEVFYKHFPSRNPFLHGLSERLGEVGRSFSKFHLFKDRISFVAKWRIELHACPPSGRLRIFLHLTSSFLPLTSIATCVFFLKVDQEIAKPHLDLGLRTVPSYSAVIQYSGFTFKFWGTRRLWPCAPDD